MGRGAAAVPGRHRARPAQRRTATENVGCERRFCGAPNSPAGRAMPPPGSAMDEYANGALPRPGSGLADLHVVLAQAVMGDDAALDARARQIEDLAREGRYLSGSYLPALSRGFAAFERGDFSGGDRGACPTRRRKRTHWRQPRAARPDRVHVVEGLSQRRPAGGSTAFAQRAATGCFRCSRRGGRGGALTEERPWSRNSSISARTTYLNACEWASVLAPLLRENGGVAPIPVIPRARPDRRSTVNRRSYRDSKWSGPESRRSHLRKSPAHASSVSSAFFQSAGRRQLAQLLLQPIEIDRLGEELGGPQFAGSGGAVRRP